MKDSSTSSRDSRAVSSRALQVARELDPARFLALLVLLIYLPALTAIAVAVVLTSAGPAFVPRKYKRPNGELVDLWEFRTECWQRYEPTRLGRFIRQSNMVRMPALVNVLKGDVEAGEKVVVA
jgi:lipopolysaccharide/colanic/teichoic acid biosynthesis glycosyltransferase